MFNRLRLAGGCALASFAFALLAAHLFNPEVASAAPGSKLITPAFPAERDDPVVVTKITLGNAVVQKGRFRKPATEAQDQVTPFQAGDDWVEGLTVYLLNRTDKPIVHALIAFTFPEVLPGYKLELGNIPAGFDFDGVGQAN